LQPAPPEKPETAAGWRHFVRLYLGIFGGALAAIYLFILLVDPFGVVPFSLPLERRIVSISQRYMYPQVIASGKFDALVVGTSTARLIDPEILNPGFNARFANLAMNSATAWEQAQIISLFRRRVAVPKALIVGLDGVWCDPKADVDRITQHGFPEWLYDGHRWNDVLYLLNSATLEVAGRMAGYWLGFYRERMRYDGFQVFVPPESAYDPERVRAHFHTLEETLRKRPPEQHATHFPALDWLDTALGALPQSTEKILAFMPVNVAAQPVEGSIGAANNAACKARLTQIAQARGAILVDWAIPSALTREVSNYWDPLHYRLPIAHDIARDLAGPVRAGQGSPAGTFRLLVGK
jgi:hypothetical protein